jgi:hypothetical protein
MTDEILVIRVLGPEFDQIDSAFMSKDQAIDVLAELRDSGVEVVPVSHGMRAIYVGSQSEPELYTDFLDWAAVVELTGGAL